MARMIRILWFSVMILLNCFKHSQNLGVAMATITVTERTARATMKTTAVY